jgi:hypothetical protein
MNTLSPAEVEGGSVQSAPPYGAPTYITRNWSGPRSRRVSLILASAGLMILRCPERRRLRGCLSGLRSVTS